MNQRFCGVKTTVFPLAWTLVFGLVGMPFVPNSAVAAADDKPQVPAEPDWRKGALFGRVIDTVTGQPLAGATVALQDKNGKVLAWAKTDAQGQYALAADSLTALQLRPSRRRGFLENVARGVGDVVSAPVKVATNVVKQVDPINTAKAAIISTVTANPAPVAAQVADTASKAVKEQAKATGAQAATQARESTARAVLGERQATPKEKREGLVPGEVFLSVIAPGYKELKAKAGAYWLEPSNPASPDGKTPESGVRAWLETVKLAPIAAADKNCEVENNAILLSDARAEPALAVAGTTVKLLVKLAVPGNQALKIRVFAREDKKRTIVELNPQEGAPGVFIGDLPLDAKLDVGDTVVTLIALRAEPIEVKLKKDKADPLLEFAKGLDDMDAGKTYEFDPRIMASENRLDLTITVLDPKKGTVSTTPATAPSSTPSAPAPPAKTP